VYLYRKEKDMIHRKGFILCAVIILTLISAQAIPGEANFVSREQVDLVKLLAPPSPDHSPRTQAEILELIQIQKMRTPQEKTLAASDDRLSVFQLASAVLGPRFTWENLPLTEKFFKRLARDGISIFAVPKEKWNRTRPFLVSADIKACSEHASSGAYPSGHSTFGYLAAIVLADMVPEKKTELFERADQYARNRMVCGVHYRSDIEAGRIVGTVIAAFAMQNPQYRKEFEEVRKEVRKTLGLP
jgi:acid phosphatase (class A)